MADYRSEPEQYERNPETGEVKTQAFPSPNFVVGLYGGGAISSLMLGFSPTLSSMQATNCLLISWMLALGALGLSILSDVPESTGDSDEDDYDF